MHRECGMMHWLLIQPPSLSLSLSLCWTFLLILLPESSFEIHILLAYCRRYRHTNHVASVLYGWSYNCLEWLKYMNKQRRARIHSPHNCLSTCRTNGWTPLFDFKQTDKRSWTKKSNNNNKIMRAIFLSHTHFLIRARAHTRSPYVSLFSTQQLICVCLCACAVFSRGYYRVYIVVLSLIFVYFPIASVL